MLIAINSDNIRCFSVETERTKNVFYCPDCKQLVILKKGCKKIHHFAHKKNSDCANKGESEAHMTAKYDLYRALKANKQFSKVEMERNLGSVRPDVSCVKNGKTYIAIEIQCSNISVDLINHRMSEYRDKGIYVIWVLTNFNTIIKDNGSSVCVVWKAKDWHKHLHGMFFGKIFVYAGGSNLQIVHLSPYVLTKQDGYNSEGECFSGYDYNSKMLRNMNIKNEKVCLSDFSPAKNNGFKKVPPCLIYTDDEKWWDV